MPKQKNKLNGSKLSKTIGPYQPPAKHSTSKASITGHPNEKIEKQLMQLKERNFRKVKDLTKKAAPVVFEQGVLAGGVAFVNRNQSPSFIDKLLQGEENSTQEECARLQVAVAPPSNICSVLSDDDSELEKPKPSFVLKPSILKPTSMSDGIDLSDL